MAHIEVPDSLVEPWQRFDASFALMKESVEKGGAVSSHIIMNLFSMVTTGAPWKDPSFCLWAYIRHGAASYNDFKELVAGWRNDQHEVGSRPHLRVDFETDEPGDISGHYTVEG